MKLKTVSLLTAGLFALAACGGKTESSVPAEAASAPSASAPAPVAPSGLVEGQNYTVLDNPIAQQQADKVEVLEFFGYFCPHCAHLEPVLSQHVKTFKDDTYLRSEHVVWDEAMKPLARLSAAVDMAGQRAAADHLIFDTVVHRKIEWENSDVLKKWLDEQTEFDGKKVLAAFESPESAKRADEMEKLVMAHQIASTPTVIVGGKYVVKFSDWESGMNTIDLLVDKVREEQKAAKK
ncbi:thiol:disulfide interchange protein DsbA/DsbL [Neisseria sp. ZJ106]|uniref:Thiol:disulfide interchange protein DsbA/DsbL n=1 Tax=Neisseria lisongii TaxID=2912188 RepID=A0ABY7RIQ2_9NEIS|nr:thiol:disulfide interchange protein DsbA/DsbL [Neisseria lisongii]MCF7522003.1 thiol:disulfide interchange protein DsbA/DsbL [Neisseria lisongii]WCL71153.1 thiol:disulfide interchange protein DsbA/DsbL [Neisseria lisongii]